MDQNGKISKKGRNKIKIAPIANSKARSTTFSKRRFGLFKKAYELSDLTRSHVKILVITDKGCLYEYASPCFESKLKSVKKVVPMMTNERILKRIEQTKLKGNCNGAGTSPYHNGLSGYSDTSSAEESIDSIDDNPNEHGITALDTVNAATSTTTPSSEEATFPNYSPGSISDRGEDLSTSSGVVVDPSPPQSPKRLTRLWTAIPALNASYESDFHNYQAMSATEAEDQAIDEARSSLHIPLPFKKREMHRGQYIYSLVDGMHTCEGN
ncbi:Floral homeotic protein AGAMOUS [Taenia crassiceps]|uniref:Floral homeotic protein AGAMOUS n=1 Tax=Taenia crassiceps TaxID=6207 RepID=A0ABR4QJQ1_9CEST